MGTQMYEVEQIQISVFVHYLPPPSHLNGLRPWMAHQTVAFQRVQPQLPQQWLQLGTEMNRAGLAKSSC